MALIVYHNKKLLTDGSRNKEKTKEDSRNKNETEEGTRSNEKPKEDSGSIKTIIDKEDYGTLEFIRHSWQELHGSKMDYMEATCKVCVQAIADKKTVQQD